MHTFKLTLLAFSLAFGITAQAATTSAKSESTMIMNSAVLQVSAIDHVGMNVPDIDAATRFFSELVGAKVISDMSPGKIPDQWKTQFRWHGSSQLQRFVMLQLTGGAKLELFQYRGAEIDPVQPHGDDAGASHIALRTDDIGHSLAVLKSKHVMILNDPITNPDGVRWFYFQAPWGSQIELVSLPSRAQ